MNPYKHNKNKTKSKQAYDIIYITVITVLYAFVAFSGLGNTKSPSLKEDFKSKQTVVAQLDRRQTVSAISIFPGLGDGAVQIAFTNSLSIDNVRVVTVEKGHIFEWKTVECNESAKYILIHAESGTEIYEMAFYDSEGNRLEVESESRLFDEQEMAAEFATYKNGTYFDEIYHVRTAYEHNNMVSPHYENSHPPLGKLIIGLGIKILGLSPFGWRFMGALFGVLMVPIMYLIARKVLKKRWFALGAASLMALDFMHYTQTRIATVDSFAVLFIMMAYLFMYRFYDRPEQERKAALKTLFISGLFFGLSAAVKWIGIYSGAGLAVLFFITLYKRYKAEKDITDTLKVIGGAALFFVIIPLVVYFAVYIPILIADKSQNPIVDFINYQTHMFSYHSTVAEGHPFTSRWYTWPLLIRPVWYFNASGLPEGLKSTISAFGNPAVWWGGTAAMIFTAVYGIIKKDRRSAFIIIGFLSQFLPWIFIGRTTFIYHFFASVPFLILAIMYAFSILFKGRDGKISVIVYVVFALILFVIFYPVISGITVSSDYVERLKLMKGWYF